MPSLPFFNKKKEESSDSAAPATDVPAAEPAAEVPVPETTTDAPAVEAASEEPAPPTVEKTVIEPSKRSFFGRRKSTDNAASESESESGTSRIPSFFGRKPKAAPTTVKEEEKENVPAAPETAAETAEVPSTEAPATAVEPKNGDKVEEKVRRRISLFQRRNRAEGAVSEGEATDGEKESPAKSKRTSFWKAAPPSEKEEAKEPAPEDSRITEAKGKVVQATEEEATAKAAFESAKKALRDAKASLKAVETEVLAEARKAKASKRDEAKPVETEEHQVHQTSIEPPSLPQVTASA